jgi:hypothetical protein
MRGIGFVFQIWFCVLGMTKTKLSFRGPWSGPIRFIAIEADIRAVALNAFTGSLAGV